MTLHFDNKRILITRNEPKASEFAEKIKRYGGYPIVTPLIKIDCQADEKYEGILEHIEDFEWIFFTSANGVNCFFTALKANNKVKRIKHVNFAVVGPKTNIALQKFGYKADFIPSIYNAKTMAPEFLEKYHPRGSVLLVRGQLSGTILNDAFSKLGISFDTIEVYKTVTNMEIKAILNKTLEIETLDYITFTSPSSVDAFIELVEKPDEFFSETVVCIGTTTEKRVLEHGFRHVLLPETFTIEGMIQRMNEHILNERIDG